MVFPLDRIQRDRVDEGVEEREGERSHLDKGEALGAKLVGPDLDGVGDDEGGEGDVVAEEVAGRWTVSGDAFPHMKEKMRVNLHEEEGYDSKSSACITSRSEAARQSGYDNVRYKHDNGLTELVDGRHIRPS